VVKRWCLKLVGLIAVGLAVTASSAVAAPPAWHIAGSIDRGGLVGLACPSASLCVAVDSAGSVLASRTPTVAASWHASLVDPGHSFSGISCPTSSLCVAVDRAGDVVTSTDPAGEAATWASSNIAAGQPLAGISCASTTVCAAIGRFVFVSSDPGGGSAAWSDTGVGRGTYYETYHYGGLPGDAPPTGISCVNAPLMCAVVNDAGDSLVSLDPTGGASTWREDGPNSGEDLAVSCVSGGLCVTTCPEGVTAGSSNCPGAGYESAAIVTWDPVSPYGPETGATVAPDNVTQIWCESRVQCFATDGTAEPGFFSSTNGPGNGHLYVSTDPTGPASAWWTAYTDHNGIAGVSCPATTCIAVDRAGNLVLGYRPPTRTQILRSLQASLRQIAAKTRQLVTQHRERAEVNAPATGEITITLRASTARTSVVIAQAAANIRRLGTKRLTIRSTHHGAKLLSTHNRLKITATISFTLPAGARTARQTTFVTRRPHPL
jgi:hypothetical protein